MMKVYQSCLLLPSYNGIGAVKCRFETVTICSSSTASSSNQCKRNRRLPTQYFSPLDLTSKKHVVASINRPSQSSTSANDVGGVSGCEQPESESLSLSDSNLEEVEEEVVECFECRDVSSNSDPESLSQVRDAENGTGIQITKLGKRTRRIESNIWINADLVTTWGVLTDYERLADFIPALALSQLLEKKDNYARLFQIGQQNLALGFKFNAKAVLDCYEKDLEDLPFGKRREIEFKMVEGDFDIFEGKWSIEQYDAEFCKANPHLGILEGQEYHTTLSYIVEVVPKLWLPVRLVEGRLCSEIKTNLSCICKEAQIRSQSSCS